MSLAQGETNTILFRSNLKMIPEVLAGHRQDPTRKFHVVGGTKESISVLNDLSNPYNGKIAERWTGVDWDELRDFSETPLDFVYPPSVNVVEIERISWRDNRWFSKL
ncbi:MAG: hypothetical protein EPN30_04605 [Actinomycetota bacterium]|nr:MAG: hypothetical protein EPN30_04605 [Actinomycetota bacterium]